MSFCTRCGTQLPEGSAFCTKCGAAASPAEAIPPPPAQPGVPPPFVPVPGTQSAAQPTQQPGPWQTTAPSPAPPSLAPLTAKKSGGFAIVFIVIAVILLALVAGAAGLIYAGYKVKEKATAFINGATSSTAANNSPAPKANGTPGPGDAVATQQGDDVDKGLNAIGALADRMGFGGPPPDPYSDLEVVKKSDIPKIECPAADTLAPADVLKPTDGRIPMREGLIVTSTWGRIPGDVDDAVTTASITPDEYTLSSPGLKFADDNDAKGHIEVFNDAVCAEDLRTAHGYISGRYREAPQISPGTTKQRLSAAAFRQLKDTGKLTLRYLDYLQTPQGDGYYKHWQDGDLLRVEPDDVPYSLIVNDVSTALPVIHARGIITPEGKGLDKDSKYAINRPTMLDLKVLDDPLNPLVLFFKFEGDSFRSEVTKIQFPNQEKKIEQELAKEKKAVVYGIYFDFNSDKIKPESKQVLDEIAEALKDNPDWKLNIDGHTDNIGGDAYNLDLSKRRSAAVKQELVTQYHINPGRLSSSGSGVAGAIDTNDTIIGRSHNRRVELTRQ